ncbi:MAG: FecR family protein, partial [Actinobacteria bacterium]|nr:FecR family protein [Actinomycetota bacterium]
MRLRHYLSILLAFAVVAGVVGTVYLRDSSEFGDMEVVALVGDVEIHRGNSVIAVGSSPESLEPQDVVVTGRDGLAKLKLEDNRTISLQTKTRLRIRSTDAVEPQSGSILAVANGAPTEVLFDDVSARFSTAMFRVDRGFGSARAATLDGRARLESRGEPRIDLAQLMQVEVAAGDLPQKSVPYRLNLRDEWDREYLASVVELTEDLDLLATGFARQVGNSRPGLSYFSELAGANVNFMKPYLSRPVADLLVGFTIADNDP